jgi:uncharacterized protein YjbI with pentapeptide repeats
MSTESSDFNFSSFQDDAQAIEVDVLLREYADGRRRFNNVDLKECDLSHARLPLINLEEALLNKANLTGANLAGATLNHVDFSAATLTNVNLIAADLVRAKLAGAKLAGAVMSGANLSGANLRKTDLTGCSFAGANLSGVDFSGATFKDVNLGGANLKGANLSEVDLSDIDLDSLNLEDTILAESVADRLWSTPQPTGFAKVTESPRVPDDSFYEDFSEPPLPNWSGVSFDDYTAAAFPLANPEELAYADTLYTSAEDSDVEDTTAVDRLATAGADGDDIVGYTSDDQALAGILADLDDLNADTGYRSIEIPFLALDPADDNSAVQDWAGAEITVVPPEDGAEGNAALLEEKGNPFSFDQPTPSPSIDLDPPASTRANPEAAPKVGPARPRSTPLQGTDGQSKSAHSLSDQVVQSIQAALGRRVQYSLQRKLLEVYQQQCALTGCTIAPLLETVFIVNDDRSIPEHPSQGLVLRSDLKTLYELKLIAIHPQKLTVLLAPSLLESDYGYLQGQKIRIPQQKIYHPDAATLTQHLGTCKWYNPNYDRDRPTTPAGQRSTVSRQRQITSLPVLALGVGSIAMAGLILAFAALQRSNLIRPMPVVAPVEQPSSVAAHAADNAINVQAGGVVYNHQGMIVDGHAHLALAQAEQLGLPVADVAEGDRIVQRGEPYVKASYLRDLDIPIAWDAETRTVTLDCCETRVETIDLAIADRALESPGVIIHNTAYVPVDKLNALNVELTQAAPQDFLQYEGVAYLKASSLKDLAVQIQWNAATRTLSLSN